MAQSNTEPATPATNYLILIKVYFLRLQLCVCQPLSSVRVNKEIKQIFIWEDVKVHDGKIATAR